MFLRQELKSIFLVLDPAGLPDNNSSSSLSDTENYEASMMTEKTVSVCDHMSLQIALYLKRQLLAETG